jgi:hypothetical protein
VFHLGIFIDNEAAGNGGKVEFFPVAFVIYLWSEVFVIGCAQNGIVYEHACLKASVATVVFFGLNNKFFVASFAAVEAEGSHGYKLLESSAPS